MITWDTGFVFPFVAGGNANYGVPFPWRTVELVPTCIKCMPPTSYDWSFFILDIVLDTAIGYAIVVLLTRLAAIVSSRR